MTSYKIAKKLKLTVSEVNSFKVMIDHEFVKYPKHVTVEPIYFGNKQEAYYSEEDMLKGITQLVKEDLKKYDEL